MQHVQSDMICLHAERRGLTCAKSILTREKLFRTSINHSSQSFVAKGASMSFGKKTLQRTFVDSLESKSTRGCSESVCLQIPVNVRSGARVERRNNLTSPAVVLMLPSSSKQHRLSVDCAGVLRSQATLQEYEAVSSGNGHWKGCFALRLHLSSASHQEMLSLCCA